MGGRDPGALGIFNVRVGGEKRLSAPHLLLVHRRTVTGKLRGAGCPVAILLLKGAQREKQVWRGVAGWREERHVSQVMVAVVLPHPAGALVLGGRGSVFSWTNECWEKEVGSGSRITSTSHRLSLPHQSHRPLSPPLMLRCRCPLLPSAPTSPSLALSASLLISSLTFHPLNYRHFSSPAFPIPLPCSLPIPRLQLPLSLHSPFPLPVPLSLPPPALVAPLQSRFLSPFPSRLSLPLRRASTDKQGLHRQYLRHHVLLAVPAAPPHQSMLFSVRQLVKRAARILRRKLRRGKKGVQQLVRRRLFLLR
ncbi:unnamed protein product [Closterium sp. NIES-64]|nr:unnamed protein product [Closterium sp. NIES-64]